jgi:DNA-binding CsgD family transcriptional regulator
MKHLILILFLSAFLIGIISLFNSFIIYIKTREKVIKFYLNLFFGLSIQILTNIAINYYLIISQIYNHLFINILLMCVTFSIFLMTFCIITSINSIYDISIKFLNYILIILLSAFFILFLSESNIDYKNNIIISNNFAYLTGVLPLSILYAIIVGIINNKKLKNINDKRNIFILIILTIIFFPLFLYSFKDVLLTRVIILKANVINMIPFSAFYIILSIFFIYYVNRKYSVVLSQNIKNSNLPEDDFYDKFNITQREKEILILILTGYDNKMIAQSLDISVNTVKVHINNIFQKTDVKSRFELIKFSKNIRD